MTRDPVQSFIDRWSPSGGAEHANYQLFLGELCDLLEVPRPDPAVSDETLAALGKARPIDNDRYIAV